MRPVSLLREMFGLALLLVWGLALLLIWRCAVLQLQQWAAEVCTMQKKSNPTEVGTAFFSKGIAILLRPKLTADILKPVLYYSANGEKQGKKSPPSRDVCSVQQIKIHFMSWIFVISYHFLLCILFTPCFVIWCALSFTCDMKFIMHFFLLFF